MWATILRYVGVELFKGLVAAAKDWYAKKQELDKKKKREDDRAKREKLLITLEVARVNGDFLAVDRISTELGKLSID